VSDANFSDRPAGSSAGGMAANEPGNPEAGVDVRIAELEAKLTAAFADAEKLREDWLRARAETDNVRRRGEEDVAKTHRFGIEAFASELLAVKDSLDAALAVENASVESFKEGVELTARQLDAVFEKYAVKPIVPEGEKFDPHRHQAISQVPSDAEPGTVVAVLQKGYLLHDRVLRPALVTVAAPARPDGP
jgi:molecular chaperone GrpE